MITQEELQSALPSNLRSSVSPELVAMVNSISSDPQAASTIRENLISYSGVMRDGKFKTEDYVNAVAYVSYKIMGYTNQESYQRTFPSRYQALMARGASSKDISAYVAAYNKNKLVNLILEQTLVPMWVLNQDIYQKAINAQFTLMTTAKSEKVRSDAANSILTHLKRPEKHQVELDIGVTDSAGMKELKSTLAQLAAQQQEAIKSGTQTQEIAHQQMIDGEAKDVTPREED